MTLIDTVETFRPNPLEVIERMAATNQWTFEREGEEEITIVVRGKDLCRELIGKTSFTDMFLLLLTGKEPSEVAALVLGAVRTGQFVIPTSAGYDEQVRRRSATLLERGLPRALGFD